MNPDAVADDLVRGVDLLCLDAGNTVIFLDHARIARWAREIMGIELALSLLIAGEGEAKRRLDGGTLERVSWAEEDHPGARAWGEVIATTMHLAGLPRERLSEAIAALWTDHVRFNLYSAVPDGLIAALARLKQAGVRTAIISNSEGMLAPLLEGLGLSFDLIVDSGRVGVAKPDPRIFRIALDELGVLPENALHLGDTFATDVLGARAAGIRTALIDPFDHYPGMHADVPRVSGVVAVVDAILKSRR